MVLLNNTYGFGSKELAAPQATLMKLVIEGVMNANLPWGLVFAGAASAAVIELLGIASLPFAVGLYLPIHLSTPIMVGGILKGIIPYFSKTKEDLAQKEESGILYASGLIAGEGLFGIIIATLIYFGVLSKAHTHIFGSITGLIFFALLTASLIFVIFKQKKNAK